MRSAGRSQRSTSSPRLAAAAASLGKGSRVQRHGLPATAVPQREAAEARQNEQGRRGLGDARDAEADVEVLARRRGGGGREVPRAAGPAPAPQPAARARLDLLVPLPDVPSLIEGAARAVGECVGANVRERTGRGRCRPAVRRVARVSSPASRSRRPRSSPPGSRSTAPRSSRSLPPCTTENDARHRHASIADEHVARTHAAEKVAQPGLELGNDGGSAHRTGRVSSPSDRNRSMGRHMLTRVRSRRRRR